MSTDTHHQPSVNNRLPLWGLVGMLLLLIAAGWGAFRVHRFTQRLAADLEFIEPSFTVSESAGDERADTIGPGPAPPPVTISAPIISRDALEPWSGTERVNFLLLGIDQRCDETGPTRTDSMLVITVDPVRQNAAALSLPRDLWVEIPGFGVNRISQAHYVGEVREYPGGGTALAVRTVEALLGVPIHYYAAINFDAFIEFIDLIGGITVTVEETIDDPNYPDRCYGIDPFYLEQGQRQLDGATALKYARTRATIGGDVDRAQRQQQVGLAIRDRILNANQLPQLIAQAPQLWQSFQTNVRTNMTPTEAIQLALLGQDIPRDQIRTVVIDFDYVFLETTPADENVLIPRRDEIRQLRNELFLPPPVPTPTVADLPEKVMEEDARVAVYNGTPVFGLAGRTETFLVEQGINVTAIGNADAATYPTTRIVDYGSHPNTTFYLSQLLDSPPLNISSDTAPDGDFDVLIILGNDWEVPAP